MRFKQDVKIFSQNSRPSRVVRKSADFTRQRKNFLPTLVLATLFWGLWGWLVWSFPPTNNLLLITFYLLLFTTVFLTSALIFANSKFGFLTACFVVLVLIFRYFQIGNILNILLLAGIFISLGFYLKE